MAKLLIYRDVLGLRFCVVKKLEYRVFAWSYQFTLSQLFDSGNNTLTWWVSGNPRSTRFTVIIIAVTF